MCYHIIAPDLNGLIWTDALVHTFVDTFVQLI